MNRKLTPILVAFAIAGMSASAAMAQNTVTANVNAVIPTNTSLVVTSGGGNSTNISIPANSALWQYDVATGNIYTSGPASSNLTGSTNKGNGMKINIKATAGPSIAGGDTAVLSKFRVRLLNATKLTGPAAWTFTPTNYTLDQITATDQVLGNTSNHGSFTVDLALDVPSSAPITPDLNSAGATVTATLVLTGVAN